MVSRYAVPVLIASLLFTGLGRIFVKFVRRIKDASAKDANFYLKLEYSVSCFCRIKDIMSLRRY